MSAPPLILSLQLDPASFALLDGLRRRHFPAERNVLAAHLTLFHKLPGEHECEIVAVLQTLCAATPPPPLALVGPRSLGRGVAIAVESAPLEQLRAGLARRWSAWLGAQDRQGFRPHVTVQNKVSARYARALFERLRRDWRPGHGRGEGLLLSRYLGGPWATAAVLPFAADPDGAISHSDRAEFL